MKIRYLYLIFLFLVNAFGISAEGLKNILLIINYNNPHYESIPLLRKIYEKDFDTIVFYGPSKHSDVHICNHHHGYLSYLAIADAMIRYPQHEGYLFLMDDCILSTWLIRNFDTARIWFAKIGFLNNCDMGAPTDLTKGIQASAWDWWNTQWGCLPMTQSFAEIPQTYKKTLAENYGEKHVAIAFSDVAYIPARYREQFVELALIFGKNKAFLETALPTLLSCLALRTEWLPLEGHSTYGNRCFRDSYKHFDPRFYFNHPIKLSYQTNRQYIEQFFPQYCKGIY